MRRDDARGVFSHRFVAIPCHAVTDTAQAPAGGSDLGLQQLAHARTDTEVAAANDALRDATGSEIARGTHRRDAVDELDLAQGRHLRRAALAVHRAAFEEDGRYDVVPTADIGQQFGEQVVAALWRVPEMVVRIDDRQVRFQRRFGVLRQPCAQGRVVADSGAAEFAFGVSEPGHSCLLLWVVMACFAIWPSRRRPASWNRSIKAGRPWRSDYLQARRSQTSHRVPMEPSHQSRAIEGYA